MEHSNKEGPLLVRHGSQSLALVHLVELTNTSLHNKEPASIEQCQLRVKSLLREERKGGRTVKSMSASETNVVSLNMPHGPERTLPPNSLYGSQNAKKTGMQI